METKAHLRHLQASPQKVRLVVDLIRGKGVEEKGLCARTGTALVAIDPRYFRPTEVDYLLSDPALARQRLGWQPKVTFKDLVRIMVDADLELTGLESPGEGRRVLEEKFHGWHRWDHQIISMER